jgi:hypothetical protein
MNPSEKEDAESLDATDGAKIERILQYFLSSTYVSEGVRKLDHHFVMVLVTALANESCCVPEKSQEESFGVSIPT